MYFYYSYANFILLPSFPSRLVIEPGQHMSFHIGVVQPEQRVGLRVQGVDAVGQLLIR